ncbi:MULTISPECIES: multidrug efflux SMR transporter [Paenibacillus]|uniref:DMT family transporter n=1 Tax=Paenibacillus TaxID=44249 RepID=UPI002FE255AA
MAYMWLALAILFEVCGTTFMKLSEGYTRIGPTIAVGVFYILSFGSLGISLKNLQVSIAYAIWSGVGMVLIAVIGFLFFKEDLNWMKAVCLMLIIAGVMGLQFSGNTHG